MWARQVGFHEYHGPLMLEKSAAIECLRQRRIDYEEDDSPNVEDRNPGRQLPGQVDEFMAQPEPGLGLPAVDGRRHP